MNLANIDIMSHITKIAVVETSTAIWEYDPELPSNRVLGGSLDVIATVRTLAIKVCTSLVNLSVNTALTSTRSSHLGNALSLSKDCNLSAGSPSRSRSLSTATFDGAQHIPCSPVPIPFARRDPVP